MTTSRRNGGEYQRDTNPQQSWEGVGSQAMPPTYHQLKTIYFTSNAIRKTVKVKLKFQFHESAIQKRNLPNAYRNKISLAGVRYILNISYEEIKDNAALLLQFHNTLPTQSSGFQFREKNVP